MAQDFWSADLAAANTGQGDKAALETRGKRATVAATEEGTRTKRALAPVQLEAAKTGVALNRAKLAAAQPKAPDKNAKAEALFENDAMLDSIATARALISKYSTGLPGQVLRNFDATQATDLKNALTNIVSPGVIDTLQKLKSQSKTGASGFGALSGKELDLLIAAKGLLLPSMSPEAMQKALTNVETRYKRTRAYMNDEDANSPEVIKKYGIPTSVAPRKGKQTVTGSEAAKANAPLLAGLNDVVGTMVSEGADPPQIRAYLNEVQPGLGDKVKNVEEVVAYVKQVPGASPGVDIEQYLVPKKGISAALGSAAESDFGAGVVGAADVLTGGFLPAATESPERTKAIMAGLQQQSPKSTMAGELAGAAALGIGGQNALLRAGFNPTAANVTLDALLGAYQGAGAAEPGSRMAGAGTGAVLGTALGAGSRAGMNALSTAVRGVPDADVLKLSRAGIRMTPGQILGGRAKEIEDVLERYPLIGGGVANRRKESLEDFNRAIFKDRLSPLGVDTGGEIGHSGFTVAERHVKDAYDQALDGINIKVDPQLQQGIANTAARLAAVPRKGMGTELQNQLATLINPLVSATGDIPGKNLQFIVRDITKLSEAHKDDTLHSIIDPILRDFRSEFEELMARQHPDNASLFKAANETYGNLASVADAVNSAPANAGGVFTPAGLKRATVTNTKAFGGKAKAARGEYPSQELIEGGSLRLPSGTGDSGTAKRIALPALLGAGLTGASAAVRGPSGTEGEKDTSGLASNMLLGAGGMGLLALPYSRPARAALQAMLTSPRNGLTRGLGDLISKYGSVPGRAIAPSAIGDYLYDPASRIDPEARGRLPVNAVPLAAEPASAPMNIGSGGSYDPETGIVTSEDGTETQVDQPQGFARGGLATMPRVPRITL